MAYQTRRKKPIKKRKKKSKTKKHPKGGIRPSILLTSFIYFLKNNNKIKYNVNLFSQNPKETSSYPQEPYLSKGPIELFAPPSSFTPPSFAPPPSRRRSKKVTNKKNTRTNKHKKQRQNKN